MDDVIMEKTQNMLRGILTLALCIAASLLLLWRAETYEDLHGRALLLDRVMCILLAVLIAMVGVTRGLALLDSQNSM